MDIEDTALAEDAVIVHTGFPNPATDHVQGRHGLALDLNKLLIRHPSSTYLFVVQGHAWETSGIFDGDTALIDRILDPKAHDLVVAWQASGFVIGRYEQLRQTAHFWGVITAIIHQWNH